MTNLNKMNSLIAKSGSPTRITKTQLGTVISVPVSCKSDSFDALISVSEYIIEAEIQIQSDMVVDPYYCPAVKEVIGQVNLRSPRFKWRLLDTGRFAIEHVSRADTLEQLAMNIHPKVIKDMAKKMTTFGPWIESVGDGSKSLNEVSVELVNVR